MPSTSRWAQPYFTDADVPDLGVITKAQAQALDGALGKALSVATQSARLALQNPAGLLVREADSRRLWYHDGAGWQYVAGGQAPVVEVRLLGGWVANTDGISQAVPTVSKSGGIVSMQGVTVNAGAFKVKTTVGGDLMCEVPAGYRPNGTVVFTGWASPDHIYRFDIGSDGLVRLISMQVGGVDRNAGDHWSVSATWTAA